MMADMYNAFESLPGAAGLIDVAQHAHHGLDAMYIAL